VGLLIDLQPSAGPVLVVGGGAIAARKLRSLAEAEFEIVVVAPDVSEEIRTSPHTTVIARPFEDADLALRAFTAVFACTDSRNLNRRVGEMARAARIPVVVADAADESTFHTPATIRQGDVAIAVSTGGASPTQARMIREMIVTSLGPRWSQIGQAISTDRERRNAERAARREGTAS
jgi:precorrin-2 dehydrogenase/sirohydrochlorin ferrochelatase